MVNKPQAKDDRDEKFLGESEDFFANGVLAKPDNEINEMPSADRVIERPKPIQRLTNDRRAFHHQTVKTDKVIEGHKVIESHKVINGHKVIQGHKIIKLQKSPHSKVKVDFLYYPGSVRNLLPHLGGRYKVRQRPLDPNLTRMRKGQRDLVRSLSIRVLRSAKDDYDGAYRFATSEWPFQSK